jgi:protein arginine N-methyltransferase 1
MITKQKVYTAGSLDILEWNIDFHNLMLSDGLRMKHYKKAIFQTIKPGMIVCDIGTGTGILAKWALEAGAEKVYGIEMNERLMERAKSELIDFGKQFIPVLGSSINVDLPEQVDCIISEILGNIMDNEDCMFILADAEKRFIKPGGIMIPKVVDSYIVPVTNTIGHHSIQNKDILLTHFHSPLVLKMKDLEISELFDFYYDSLVPKSDYLSLPQKVSHMEKGIYQRKYQKTLIFDVMHAGIFTGFKGFFKAKLSENILLDIESSENISTSWKHAYFPVKHSFDVQEKDTLTLVFTREINNTYQWEGYVKRNEKKIYQFKQTLKNI